MYSNSEWPKASGGMGTQKECPSMACGSVVIYYSDKIGAVVEQRR